MNAYPEGLSGMPASPSSVSMNTANEANAMPDPAVATQDAANRIKLSASPYRGNADFTPLVGITGGLKLDPVSIADLLRNAFVYPPHSIYRDVKVASLGFDPERDLHSAPEYRFSYRSSPAPARPGEESVDEEALLQTYHRLLCEAVSRSTTGMHAPWLLQSGGKDSTSLAIAVAETRPDARCLTYLGGREEDEVASARSVARQLGLRHEALVCKPARAYDRYLAMVPRMPLLSADFALLSYADLATEIAQSGGDGVIDGLGSDIYFGTPVDLRRQVLVRMARGIRLPSGLLEASPLGRSFVACFVLATLGMDSFERYFPGSRFSDQEVDRLLGRPVAAQSRQRLQVFKDELAATVSDEGRRRVSLAIAEAAAAFPKGQYTTSALGLRQAYPFCDAQLSEWVYRHVPDTHLIDREGHNKPLVRKHITRRFGELPYVKAKGCFRFDLCGLAAARFDQVHAFAVQASELMPGAVGWLEAHRGRMGNKFFASKFYLLAIILPWLLSRAGASRSLEPLE
ncbi:asparagine synthase-related protein [Fulvimonas yonginensis]|uniref:Asparagine synthase-related protein n=1 Tax=Fulvimonas yonginensis TaxID=1495200 RepID=A0ABU8J961_9GAMM